MLLLNLFAEALGMLEGRIDGRHGGSLPLLALPL
jgi:hypothetical protein